VQLAKAGQRIEVVPVCPVTNESDASATREANLVDSNLHEVGEARLR
jgi:hypothetical protein